MGLIGSMMGNSSFSCSILVMVANWFKVFQSRKMSALIFLGFASGLPFYLSSKNPIQAWMSEDGVSLEAIGAFGLVSLPYSLKFLWSPLLDRFVPPFLGRRRGWLVISQIALIVAIAAMALQNPSKALQFLAINAFLIAFFSATQDILADAYRTDVLEKPELGAGASVFLLGYRLAIIFTSYLPLWIAEQTSWNFFYLLMSALMIIGLVNSFFAPEPPKKGEPPKSLKDAIVYPFLDFLERNGLQKAIFILLFITIYKLGDAMVKNLSTPFLLEQGLNFSKSDLALPGTLSIIATIVGTLAGGAIMTRIGINRSLWIFAIVQAVGNLMYFALALVGRNQLLMIGAINVESFCSGLESAAFVAFLMSLCNQRFSATQYALLSSLVAFSRDILVAPSGIWAKAMGWPNFFLMTAIAALPGLILLPFFAPWHERDDLAPQLTSRFGSEDEDE
jgi:PAT family beta-lactamase induction signal transducer AmpG